MLLELYLYSVVLGGISVLVLPRIRLGRFKPRGLMDGEEAVAVLFMMLVPFLNLLVFCATLWIVFPVILKYLGKILTKELY